MNTWIFGKLRLWGAVVQRRAKEAEAGKKCATEKEERGEGSLPFSVIFYACPTGIGSRFSRRKKKPWSSLLQMNIPKRKAFCKHGKKNAQVFYRSRLLKRLQFSNINAKMKKQGLFLLGVRPSCLRISPLLTLDSLEIGVQEIAERAIA